MIQIPLVGAIWNHGLMSSFRSDWATPRQLFEMLDMEFHFTLDACSQVQNRVTTSMPFYDPSDIDALGQNVLWSGSVWCNPPYGRKIGDWIHKGLVESIRGSTVVMLLPARTDTKWWHEYCMKGEIRFLQGRLCFDDARLKRAPFPSAIVVFRPPAARERAS